MLDLRSLGGLVRASPALRVSALALVLLAGCRKSGLEDCTSLLKQGRYGEAAARCEQVFNAGGDSRAGLAAARAWGRMAWDHTQRNEVDLAETAYRRSLTFYQKAGDAHGSADTLYRLYDLCWRSSRYREAFQWVSQAFEQARKTDDQDLKLGCALGLAIVLYDIGDIAGARSVFDLAERLGSSGDPVRRAYLLLNRSNLWMEEKRFSFARRDLEQALTLAAGKDDRELFRSIHLNLVDLDLEDRNLEDARRHLEAAWSHAGPEDDRTALLYYQARVDKALGRAPEAEKALLQALKAGPVPDWGWSLEHQLGQLAEARGDPGAAEAAYQRSARIVEEMRRNLELDDLKSWLLDRKRQPFESLFLLQARAGRAREALTTADRAQAGTFLDALLAVPPAEAAGEPGGAAAAGRLEALVSLLPAMTRSPAASPQPIGRALEAFGDREGLIYFEAGDALWLIRVSGSRISLRPLGVSPRDAEGLVDRFVAHPDDAEAAGRLGEALLPPGSLPKPGRTVYIVADGALGKLPFAAVRRDGRYLVEDHALVIAPSLTALIALESQPPRGGQPAVVLADSRGDLPAAAAEGREVGSLLGAPPRIAGGATSMELKRAAGARLLHLAVHTGLGSQGPWIRLADRDVTAAEIVAGRIAPRLVVLASCASAARRGRPMWGSLGTAFLAAGSRSVVASLWSVEDEKAREFVSRFYAQEGAADPAGALARAQRVAIGQGVSPSYWAPFVLLGSGRP